MPTRQQSSTELSETGKSESAAAAVGSQWQTGTVEDSWAKNANFCKWRIAKTERRTMAALASRKREFRSVNDSRRRRCDCRRCRHLRWKRAQIVLTLWSLAGGRGVVVRKAGGEEDCNAWKVQVVQGIHANDNRTRWVNNAEKMLRAKITRKRHEHARFKQNRVFFWLPRAHTRSS